MTRIELDYLRHSSDAYQGFLATKIALPKGSIGKKIDCLAGWYASLTAAAIKRNSHVDTTQGSSANGIE